MHLPLSDRYYMNNARFTKHVHCHMSHVTSQRSVLGSWCALGLGLSEWIKHKHNTT